MKKFYFEPEMNISTFSEQDVVTTSGVMGTDSYASDYENASSGTKAAITYDTLGFNFADMSG